MALFDSLEQMKEQRRTSNRRRFLIGGMAGLATYLGYRWWRYHPRRLMNKETAFITPNPRFYTIAVDESFSPQIKLDEWRLKVSGPDGKGYSLSYEELVKLEHKRIYKTFECIGNEPGGPLIGNAEWTVTPLAPIINRAMNEGKDDLRVVFRALDGFYSSVPIDIALSDQAFIAYEMNGEVLPKSHGFPARVLLPGKYGMKQPRWLSEIEVTDSWTRGYWENRGWSYDTNVKMTARVDAAIQKAKQPNSEWLITGIAYCGAESVGQVEVSFDEGKSWQQAKLTSETQPNAWATWAIDWQPSNPGECVIAARVTDKTGARQIEGDSTSFPSGATGLHRVIVYA